MYSLTVHGGVRSWPLCSSQFAITRPGVREFHQRPEDFISVRFCELTGLQEETAKAFFTVYCGRWGRGSLCQEPCGNEVDSLVSPLLSGVSWESAARPAPMYHLKDQLPRRLHEDFVSLGVQFAKRPK